LNDTILSGLLNIFALFGSEKGLDKDESLLFISVYLNRYFGVRNPQSYLNLYSDLRDFYDGSPELDRVAIVRKISTEIKNKIKSEEQLGMMLRLMEFCGSNRQQFDWHDPIFVTFSQNLGIGEETLRIFANYISGNPDEGILIIPLDSDAGIIKTLYIKETNLLVFTYIGNREVRMDDIPVLDGVFMVWKQSGVVKCKDLPPMYYSSVMSMYDKEEDRKPIELSGRDIEFRFNPSLDNGMHDFSFTLRSGQLVAIMGGSGVGKSTLQSLLNGSLRPQSGTVTINGHDILEPEAKSLIGFVPQDDLLVDELTVYQNLWFTGRLCFDRMSEEELDLKVMSVLTQLGLDTVKDLKVGSPLEKYISGGQRKRLNIALELIREPAILFLDEPTSGLSSTDTEKVMNLLKEQTCKGRLIIVNIHQPSSDIYKLFDRLWLLDKGGYPIYDGNPIEAISWFKKAANYTDAQVTACPVCGNVNPEIVLDIIDEKALDASGHTTEKRKVTPEEWHRMYLDERGTMPPVQVSEVPPTDQKRPSPLRQALIFLRRNFSAKITNLQYLLVTLLEAPLLSVICGVLTRYVPDSGVYSVMENRNMVSYFFMAIIVAVFLGMSGSAEEIIRDRSLLKREKFLNLSYRSYIWSKMVFMAGVCAVQTLEFIIVGNLIMGLSGLFMIWFLILFLSAFLSALIGLLLSQCMNSVVAIYISIPLLLIPQILLCGLVVDFDDLNPSSKTGNVPVIGDLIPSRWAFEALAVSNFSRNGYEKHIFSEDRDKFTCQYYEYAFLHELEAQVEQRNDEIIKGKEKQSHIELIRTEFEHLAEICGLEQYDGDESYESLLDYIGQARTVLRKYGSYTTLAMDRQMNAFIAEYGMKEITALKRDNYNIQLENLVLNRNTEKYYVVRGNRILPRCGYVFLTPRSKNGRAPFYSGVKVLGNHEIDTLWFNMGVLALMCILVAICLFRDFPGQYIRKQRGF